MEFPEELKYTEEHEWVMIEEDLAVVGITDFAQDALGDVVFVELPEVGTAVEAGKAFGVVESVKAVSDVYAPLTGTIEEVNDDLIDAPEIINTSPYEDGWMVKIRMAEASDADELMDAEAYQALIAEES
ncbi:MAG: glycine cleavage system protein GcvH [Deltaproteobacteria bacterium]|jgi:glycine cleavage system H protein|nr:glycine cleavage system protein GcvH [Deltaproteobacteria bacterium]MBW2511395.1 glycine cleavage system protein GcvH [Deltaproteobacteria bacterium]